MKDGKMSQVLSFLDEEPLVDEPFDSDDSVDSSEMDYSTDSSDSDDSDSNVEGIELCFAAY